jgi:ligand-binding sensor domain-containing protein
VSKNSTDNSLIYREPCYYKARNLFHISIGKHLKAIFFLFISFAINHSVAAQLQLNRLSQTDGLSNTNVNCILQDHIGFMWFGTNDGLNRYDGYSFTVFRTSTKDTNSIGSNYITCLYEDPSGLLWIGTKGGGLNIYNSKTETFIRYMVEHDEPNSINSNDVLAIYYENRNRIWIGTDGGGLNLFDFDTGKFQHFNKGILSGSPSGSEVIAIEGNTLGTLWIGTWNGGLNMKKARETNYSVIPDSNGIEIKHIWSLTNDSDRKLWIGTFGYGLYCYDQENNKLQKVLLNEAENNAGDQIIWTVFFDKQKCMWIGTNNGLFKIENGESSPVRFAHSDSDQFSIPSNKVMSIYQSSTGILWIGTDNGVCYLKPDTKKFQKNLNISKLENNSIYALAPAQNNGFWIASQKSGISKVKIEKSTPNIQVSFIEDLKISIDGKVNTILQDSKNLLWIGTRYGLISYNLKTNSTLKYYFDKNDIQSSSNDVMAIFETGVPDEYWVGTDNGLFLFNHKTELTKKYVIDINVPTANKINHILSIYNDKRNNIWVSTWNGLNLYDPKTDSFSLMRESWANNLYINSMHDDSRGNLWLGTRSGLYKYNIESDSLLAFSEEDGLCNNNICSIVDDLSGNLWLGTNKGLSKYNLNTSEFKNFDSQEGMLNNTFSTNSGFLSSMGIILLGGTNGLDAFVPTEIKINHEQVTVVLNDFRIFSKTVPVGVPGSPLKQSITGTKQIVLTARDEIFSIGFVALSFVNSNKCKYMYKLEPFEKDWNQVGLERKANYTNIKPGDYIFKVKASNEDGIWNNDELSLNITMLPPWWKTFWFKIILVIAVFLLFFMYYRYRVYQYHQRNKILEKIIEERVKEIKHQQAKLSVQAQKLSESNQLLNEQKNEIERQGLDIKRMNEILMLRNVDLEENVEELSRARAMNTSVTFEEFQRIYPNDESCRKFIYELKLKTGFCCHNCQSTESQDVHANYTRRCKKCGYVESVTVGTIFLHLKFPIVKAFYILYLVSAGHKLTVDKLSDLISLRRETCWTFKSKIEAHMKQYKRFKNPNEGWKEMILIKN